MVGTIKAIVNGKYGLEYKDGVLRTAIEGVLSEGGVSLQLAGVGATVCNKESCNEEVVDNPGTEFCIFDNLGIIVPVGNVLDYTSC
ncbi:MAG: hypothetical protein MRQ11_05000 [Candidatus Midichloria mitochondrii]|nr:hypothetical protein [Candidatus Midichloria mitochondrii]